MKKLSEFFKKLWEKFKSFSKGIKIVIIVAIIAVCIAIVSAIVISGKDSYSTLFYDLDSSDAQTVIASLEEQKVIYKVEGSDILVDSSMVDKLRLELSSSLSDASKGYELMDSSSSFGMTDDEFKIYKVRMIQGELERSIETLDSIEDAKVLITPASDSVFVQSATSGNASIVLKVKNGIKLSKENVQAIVSMVSMGTENIPQENISIVDTNGNLLTKDIANSDSGVVTSETIESQQGQESTYESKIVEKIKSLLEPVVGVGNVQAQVNVDLDFDSKKITEYEIDPNDVLISQETENSYNESNNGGTVTESPVDNNMSNTIEEEDEGNSSISKSEHQINNYDHSNKETETIVAPGEVRRMTVSVFVNGKLDANTQEAFEDAIKSATGYDENRSDTISLVGMNFDTTLEDEAKAQVDAYNETIEAESKKKMIIGIAIAAGVLIGVIVLLIVLKKKDNREEEALLDVIIGDENSVEPVKYEPIDFGQEDEKTHLENEIKKYAQEKPEQVADIIKSWLSENER